MIETNKKPLPPLACIVLAAGQGTRMRSSMPKVLHKVASLPMVRHVVNACEELNPQKIVVVAAPGSDAVAEAVAPHTVAIQSVAMGTGDAVKAARDVLKDFKGDILVLFGDAALVTGSALTVIRERRSNTGAAIIVSSFEVADPAGYGRLVLDDTGSLAAIIEAKDATPEQLAVNYCNGGIMLFDSEKLWPLLDRVTNNNAKKEYYLTDCVKIARDSGYNCAIQSLSVDVALGINTRAELALAENRIQKRLREKAMLAGVTMVDPNSVFLCTDTRFGTDVVIEPNVIFGPGVKIADNVQIRAFSYLEEATVGEGAVIGPYARLRPQTVVGPKAKVGNFVEIKKSEIAEGAKVPHLTYIGDTYVGPKANIGAGTITCNYDGVRKSHTHIGAGVFIGSNTALVAPVTVGDGAIVGAGTVVTKDVSPYALATSRTRQSEIESGACRFRERQKKGVQPAS